MTGPTSIYEANEAFTYSPPNDDESGLVTGAAFILWVAEFILLVCSPAIVVAVWQALL